VTVILKNCYSFLTGFVDGLDMGNNTKVKFITNLNNKVVILKYFLD